jgi:hypothetical protein
MGGKTLEFHFIRSVTFSLDNDTCSLMRYSVYFFCFISGGTVADAIVCFYYIQLDLCLVPWLQMTGTLLLDLAPAS